MSAIIASAREYSGSGMSIDRSSRVAMVAQVEEAIRSLRSISEWLKEQRGTLELMGVSRADIRRIRNETASSALAMHHNVAQQVIRLAPRAHKIVIPGEG